MARYRVGLETRARILEATRDLLGEVGFDGVTLKKISHRAGVGAGSFYNLFDSKEEAVLEVIRQALSQVDPDPSGLGNETLADLVDAFVEFITGETANIARIYLQLAGQGLADPRIGRAVLRSHNRRVERFTAAIRREHPALPAERARAHADLVLASLTGHAITWLLDPEHDFRAAADHVLELDPAVAAAGRGAAIS